jgi:hypothetical protein
MKPEEGAGDAGTFVNRSGTGPRTGFMLPDSVLLRSTDGVHFTVLTDKDRTADRFLLNPVDSGTGPRSAVSPREPARSLEEREAIFGTLLRETPNWLTAESAQKPSPQSRWVPGHRGSGDRTGPAAAAAAGNGANENEGRRLHGGSRLASESSLLTPS